MKISKKNGFTLIELLIAIAVMGIITIGAVKTLYDILVIRAKQQSLENTSDNFRSLLQLVTTSIHEAQYVSVTDNNEVRIVGPYVCRTIKFDPATGIVAQAEDAETPCTPPDSNFKNITGSNLIISNFTFSPIGTGNTFINIDIEGTYRNSLGDHPVKYQTTITPRL